MTPTAILHEVRRILSDQLDLAPDDIRQEHSIVDDLGADSLDVVELTIETESFFDIDIPDQDLDTMRTVQDVADYVARRLDAKGRLTWGTTMNEGRDER